MREGVRVRGVAPTRTVLGEYLAQAVPFYRR